MDLSNIVSMPWPSATPLPSNGNVRTPPRPSLRERLGDYYAAEALVRLSLDLPDLVARLDRALAVR